MKNYILLIVSFVAACFANAQITVTKSHMLTAGKHLVVGYDNQMHALPSKGANQVWDMRNLIVDDADSFKVGNARFYPGNSYFSAANLSMVYYSDPLYVNYFGVSDSGLISYGGYFNDGSNIDVDTFIVPVLRFPASYQGTFNTSRELPNYTHIVGYDPDTAGPWPVIDSVVITSTFRVESNIDGWGQIRTPLGDFDALRQNVSNTFVPRYRMYSNGVSSDIPPALLDRLNISASGDTSYTISFWTNNANLGFPLVTIYHNVGEDSSQDIEWLASMPRHLNNSIPILHSRVFVYPNPATDILNIEPGSTPAIYTLYDMSGRLVMEGEMTSNGHISVKDLSAGIYTLKVMDKHSGTSVAQRILVE